MNSVIASKITIKGMNFLCMGGGVVAMGIFDAYSYNIYRKKINDKLQTMQLVYNEKLCANEQEYFKKIQQC